MKAKNTKTCHGCKGLGWVTVYDKPYSTVINGSTDWVPTSYWWVSYSYSRAQRCPVCEGKGEVEDE